MALLTHQKIQYVLPGLPFGNGADGALTVSASATQTLTDETCTGTATSTALTAGGTSIADGDVVLIHQSRGTGAGQWEVNKVASGGGSVNLVMSVALKYSYAAGAQVIKIPMYTDVTVNSSQIWSAKAWDGSTGGFLIFAAKGTVTISGTLNGNTLGFLKGAGGGETAVTAPAYRGEGTSGDNGTQQASANGNGAGGGGVYTWYGAGGGGGSNGSAGVDGQRIDANSDFGAKGATAGHTELTTMVFGGAGGGGGGDKEANPDTAYGGDGGNGGGGIIIFGKTISSPNSLTSIGGNGSNAEYAVGSSGTAHGGGGGAGAGGSILIAGGTVNIGTDKLTTVGGVGGEGSRNETNDGGSGGKGRIAVYYGTSLTGSISASLYGSYTNEQDTSLIESGNTLLGVL